jgi:hypothetical protein
MAAVEASRRPFERRAEAHEAMGSNLSLDLVALVELDDEAAQCFVDGHLHYKQREYIDSQSQ